MNKILIALLMLLSFNNTLAGPKVHVFNKTIELPDECVLYARPTIIDSTITYFCNERSIRFMKYQPSDIEELSKKESVNSVKINKLRNLSKIEVNWNIWDNHKTILYCDNEICMSLLVDKSTLDNLSKQLTTQVE